MKRDGKGRYQKSGKAAPRKPKEGDFRYNRKTGEIDPLSFSKPRKGGAK